MGGKVALSRVTIDCPPEKVIYLLCSSGCTLLPAVPQSPVAQQQEHSQAACKMF